jgi:hypothetical protein
VTSAYTVSSNGGWPKNSQGEFVNPDTHEDYLAWIAAGHTPDIEPEPVVGVQTAAEKLAALGLDADELKTLLGLS